jgi:hypothetical protein
VADTDRVPGQREPDVQAPADAGRTSGGGNLGHNQPDKVRRDLPIRNNATGDDNDPVMPQDDATLKTKI